MIEMLGRINDVLVLWFGGISIEHKAALSLLGAALAALGYAVAVIQTYRGKSYPNPMSWFAFGLLTLVDVWVMHKSGAGAGTWTMEVSVAGSFAQCFASLLCKPKGWKLNDFPVKAWVTLGLGVGCFAAYLDSKALGLTALGAVAFATLSDFLTYGPAIISSWKDPWGENGFSYSMQSLKNAPAVAALVVISPENWLYYMMLLLMNGPLMITYFMVRRSFVPRKKGE